MIVSHIVAASENGAIGIANGLPWHIPEDLKFFKETTKNSVIVMGRKTYDSLGKPLPKRVNIVVSRSAKKSDFPQDVILHTDIAKAVNEAKDIGDKQDLSEVFIVGGSEIYKQTLEKDLVDRIYLTRVFKTVKGDAFYPDVDLTRFKLSSERLSENEDCKYAFLTFDRK